MNDKYLEVRNAEVLAALQGVVQTYKVKLWAAGIPHQDFEADEEQKQVAEADFTASMARANMVLAKWGLQ